MAREECVQLLVFQEALLLDDLCVDTGGSERFDLRDNVVANALDSLGTVSSTTL